MYSAAVSAFAEHVRERVRSDAALSLAADVDEGIARDLAIALSSTSMAVVRCVDRSTPEDHAALGTMVVEGDFVWAGLVSGEREGLEPVGPVATFHVSELDRLVARLRELGGGADEAR